MENKRVFSKIGLSITIAMAVSMLLSRGVYWIIKQVNPDILNMEVIGYLFSYVPLILVVLPVFYLMVKNMPDGEKREQKKLKVSEIIILFFIIYFISFIGGLITEVIVALVNTVSPSNINTLVSGINLQAQLICTVIIAPILDGVIFRGIMLNKLRGYSDKVVIITTAVLCGLSYSSPIQFLYITAIAMVLSYVVLKTGTLKYSIILHMIISAYGSVILPLILGDGTNETKIVIYSIFFILPVIIGLILLIIKRKKISLLEGDKKLQKGTAFKTIWINVGMILNIIFSLIMVFVYMYS